MKTRLRSCSLLLCLAVVMAASPGFAATPGADARRDRVAQMLTEGWQQVAPGVLQRTQGHQIETFAMGSEGFSWLARELQVRHGLLLDEYRLHPAPALMKEIQSLAQQIEKVQDSSQRLASFQVVVVPVCATSYSANATAYPMTTAPGARADADASFSSDCGSSGDTYAYAYARGTLNGTTTTVTQTDPDSGSSVSGYATASAPGDSDCYSYATSRVISFDEGISYSVAAENFDCQTIKINDVSVTEGNAGTKTATFTVTLSSPSSGNVTVTAQTADGTATAPSDYTAQTRVLTFGPNVASQTFSVVINGDLTYELDETFTVNLSGASGATILDAQGVGTILNDDSVSISINDVSQNEGQSGTSSMTFNVTLSNPSSFPVTVTCQTANGTATAPSDYLAVTTVLTFGLGQVSQPCTVTINGDTTSEPNETFTANLSGASGGTIVDAQGVGTIVNDDTTIMVNDMTVDEGSVTDPSLTVTLSSPSAQTVSVSYATADGLALSTVDYVAVSGTLTFLPGEVSKTILLALRRDTLPELPETFFVNFTNPVGASLSKSQAKITLNDDDAVTWSLLGGDANTTTIPGCVTLSQVGNGRGSAYNFKTFPLTNKFDMTFRVGFGIYDVVGGGGMVFTLAKEGFAGLGGSDMGYQSVSPSVGVEMDTLANYTIDPPEDHMAVDENGGTAAHAGHYAVQASATSANIEDGFEHTFRVTRDPATLVLSAYFDDSLRLTYYKDIVSTLYGGVTNTHFGMTGASNCNEAPTCPNNVLYFCPVAICIGNTATPQVQVDDIQVSEGNAGNQTATFKVNLFCPRNETVTVNYATADGTATAGLDYLATAGVLVFAPGETQKTVAVTVYPDPTSEPDETFKLNLSNPSVNLATPDTQAVATIIDDVRFAFGQAGDVPLWGDWNGDGIDTPGLWRNGTFYLRNSNTPGPADVQFNFGGEGDVPIVGDWTGSGIDRVGMWNTGYVYLKTANTAAASTINFIFGQMGDRPIAGDWNGDGIDTIGVQRGTTFILHNVNGYGGTDVSFAYGLAGDVAIAGDWNGDGIDTVGVFRNGGFYLRNSNTTGIADVTINNYGAFSDLPLAGDLDGDNDDAVGYFRSGTFVLRK